MSVVPATPQLAPLSEQHFSPVETFERQLSTACRRSPPEVNDVAAVGVSDGGGGLGELGGRGRGGATRQTPIGSRSGFAEWTAVQVASPQQTPEASPIVPSKEQVSTHSGGGLGGGGGLGDGGRGGGGLGGLGGSGGLGGGGLGAGLGLAATIRSMRVRSNPRLMLKPQKSSDVSLQPAHACKVTLSSFIADIVIDEEV